MTKTFYTFQRRSLPTSYCARIVNGLLVTGVCHVATRWKLPWLGRLWRVTVNFRKATADDWQVYAVELKVTGLVRRIRL